MFAIKFFLFHRANENQNKLNTKYSRESDQITKQKKCILTKILKQWFSTGGSLPTLGSQGLNFQPHKTSEIVV
jgi:hypothetical protein